MKQRGHTWIALRAIGLIQEDSKTKDLAKVLAPKAKESYIGCWLPDMGGFKKGHGVIGNHTFKNAPYKGADKARFVVPREKLLKSLDSNLALHGFISKKSALSKTWWKASYKAVQANGEHLPDCLASLFDTVADMLLLGDRYLEPLVPGKTGYRDDLSSDCAISKAEVSTFFFMLSHYVADCFMPCHADKRKLCAFSHGSLHKGWEAHWETMVGTYFDKDKLKKTKDSSNAVIKKAEDLDATLGLKFKTPLTWGDEKHDIWDAAINWCRASFAFSCNLFPVKEFPYDSKKKREFKTYFDDPVKLAEYDRIVLQSAVYAVASTWKRIWRKFKK